VLADLRQTGSMDMTTDNILDGQLDEAPDSDSDQSDGSASGAVGQQQVFPLRQRLVND